MSFSRARLRFLGRSFHFILDVLYRELRLIKRMDRSFSCFILFFILSVVSSCFRNLLVLLVLSDLFLPRARALPPSSRLQRAYNMCSNAHKTLARACYRLVALYRVSNKNRYRCFLRFFEIFENKISHERVFFDLWRQ